MALVVKSTQSEENKGRRSSFRSERKPWMLKDYLGDDLSSCSSNGFRSFPRKQCCATVVRNIIDKDVVLRHCSNNKVPKLMKSPSRCFSSSLQRASMAVVNVVKLLPFKTTIKSYNNEDDNKKIKNNANNNGFLSRSFSRKIFRRSFFWKSSNKEKKSSNSVKKECVVVVGSDDHDVDEIERWISSGVVGKEKYEPLDLSNDTTTVTTISTTSVSNNSDDKSDDSSSSWFDDVTFSCCSTENDAVERREKLEEEEEEDDDVAVSKRVGEDSVKLAVIEESLWYNEETEKEQSSPISVLDFLYNEEENSSPFTQRVLRLEGTQERLMKKLGRFECLAGLEPINLETLISSKEVEDPSSPKYSIQPCATPSYILSISSEEDEEEEEEESIESNESEVEKHAQNLLHITKKTMTPSKIKLELENVLLDFFRDNSSTHKNNDTTLLKMAENWLNGQYDTLILGWEVKDKRQAYIRDMEEGGWWPRDTRLEREEISSKLGDEVLVYLLEELMVEF